MESLCPLTLILTTYLVFVEGSVCPDAGTIETVSSTGRQHIDVRYGRFLQMTCCVQDNGSGIVWYKLNRDTGEWETISSSKPGVLFIENSQVMIIQSVKMSHTGEYKCVVSSAAISSASNLSKSFDVNVAPCDSLARGPFPIAPLPCADTVAKIGDTVVLPCTGYFGCENSGDIRIVNWLISEKDEVDNWIPVPEGSNKYIIREFNKHDGVMGANLTINQITEEDFNMKFMCILATMQSIQGQTQMVTSLIKYADDENGLPALFHVVIILASLLAVAVCSIFAVLIFVSRSNKKKKLRLSKKRNINGDIVQPCLTVVKPAFDV